MIKVFKVADIIENKIMPSPDRSVAFHDVARILMSLEGADDPIEAHSWEIPIEIGEGTGMRTVRIELPQFLDKSDDLNAPIFFCGEPLEKLTCAAYYDNGLFYLHRAPQTLQEKEEILLRIKKVLFDEAAEISSLRATVANLEAAIEYQRTGPIRDPISDEVKIVVWARDGGSCRRCGIQKNLQFDHIIPVAKGGGNSTENIQILCQHCNLRKSDRIAMP